MVEGQKRRQKDHFRELEELWAAYVNRGNKAPQQHSARIVKLLTKIEPPCNLVQLDGSLGIGARIRLVFIASNLTIPAFAKATYVSVATLNRAFDPASKRPISPETINAVLKYHNRSNPNGPTLDSESFRSVPFSSAQAIASCSAWLSGASSSLSSNRELLDHRYDYTLIETGTRFAQLQEVEHFLTSSQPTFRPIKVLYQSGMSAGLSAVAAELFRRTTDPHSLLHGKSVCYLPLSRSAANGRNVTFAMLVAYLKAFYENRSLTQAAPPMSTRTLYQDVEFIRRKMSTAPAIFILDGYGNPGSALPALSAAIVDDPLMALLNEVAHPYVGDADGVVYPSSFYQNRFLVLSECDIPGPKPLMDTSVELVGPPNPTSETPSRKRPVPYTGALKRSANKAELLALIKHNEDFLKDDLIGVVDRLFELRKKRGEKKHDEVIASIVRGSATASFSLSIQMLVDELENHDKLAVTVLRILALTPGGLRIATLARVLEQLQQLNSVKDERTRTRWDACIKDGLDLSRAINLIGNLVTTGPDEFFFGLDDASGASSFENAQALASIDFHSNDLRSGLITQLMAAESNMLPMVEVHRLLCEEAIRQQTAMMLKGNWRDTLTARFYRRLYQALFHGFLSLAQGPGQRLTGFDHVAHILPTDNDAAYLRLYAVFFRKFLDTPPHWELSRVYAREALKSDIARLAMSAGTPASLCFGRSDEPPPDLVVSPFLKTDSSRPDNATVMNILLDQLTVLARTSFHLHLLPRAIDACDLANNALQHWRDLDAERKDADLSRCTNQVRKISIDIALLEDKPGADGRAGADAREALVDAGFRSEWLAEINVHVDQLNRSTDPDQAQVELLHFGDKLVSSAVATLNDQLLASRSSQSALWSDYLTRFGEAEYLNSNIATVRRSDAASLIKALVYLIIAERFRRWSFTSAPLGRDYVLNAHAARVISRVSLSLVELIDAPELRDAVPLRRQFLAAQARRHIDILARYVSRYPSERTSLLVLEAHYERVVASDSEHLLRALKLVARAETIMWATLDRPRVRLRLLLERIQILMARAKHAIDKPSDDSSLKQALRYAEFAVYDVIRLRRLADHSNLLSWITAAKRCAIRLYELCDSNDLEVPLKAELGKVTS